MNPKLWDLSYRDNVLQWDGTSLQEVAERFGTPLYVLSESRLRKNVDNFSNYVHQVLPQSEIYLSCKTSGLPEILPIMISVGIGAEVVAGHELEIALMKGLASSNILFSGVNRTREELRHAVDAGVKVIIIDLLSELMELCAIAKASSGNIEIALRVAVGIDIEKSLWRNTSSVSQNHLGLDPKSEEFKEALRVIGENERLRLTGLHSHVGTGIHNVKVFRKNVEQLVWLYVELLAAGFPMKFINVGGGLGVQTVKEFSNLELLRYAAWGHMPQSPGEANENLVKKYVDAVAQAVAAACQRCGCEQPGIAFEPGRILTSDAVLLLLRVGAIRKRSTKLQFAFVDGGSMSVGMSCLAEYHEIFPIKKSSDGTKRYTIIGRVPTPLDIVYRNKKLPELSVGEYLAVMDAGAYFIPTATNFATLKPAVVKLCNGEATRIRRAESASDLLRRESLHG